jgi:hypothetical protein
LQSALSELVKKGATVKGTAKATGVPLATLKRWLKGAAPNAKSVGWLPRLERYFALPAGALGDLVPQGVHKPSGVPADAPPDDYRQRLRANCRSPYALKEPLPALKEEWLHLLRFKAAVGQTMAGFDSQAFTQRSGRSGGARRSLRLAKQKGSRWSGTSLPVVANTEKAWFAMHDGNYVATAAVNWTMVSQFLGWLQLATDRGGVGLTAGDAQTLANLTRDDYIEGYIEWRVERAGGVVHNGVKTFLTLVRGLCNPRTGFLTQSYATFSLATDARDEQEWRKFCESTYHFAVHAAEDLSPHLQRSRDPFRAIGPSLELPNPLDAVADAIARLDADRPSTGGLREAVWARDRLLVKLLASNPLRDKNLRLLTYKDDNSGHLRKVNGEWRIAIPRHEFKNARGAARHRPYDMPVRREVWPDIERYLRDYRPVLAADGNPYVFVSTSNAAGPMYSLRRRFELLTRAYLAGCSGVGPHAMRYIVATSILKARPNDWAAAAWALHDLEETVRQHYVHLRCDDAQRWMTGVMDGPFSRM